MNPSDRRGFVYHKIILKKFESCKTLFPREPVQFLFPHTPHCADKDVGLGLAELPATSARRSEAGGRGLPPGAAGECCRTQAAPCQVSKCLAVVVGWPLTESKTSAFRWHSNAPPCLQITFMQRGFCCQINYFWLARRYTTGLRSSGTRKVSSWFLCWVVTFTNKGRKAKIN